MDCWDTYEVTAGREVDTERTFHLPKSLVLDRARNIPAVPTKPVWDLPKTSSKTFNAYFRLLLHNEVVICEDDMTSSPDSHWTALVELYALAAELDDKKSADMVMDRFVLLLELYNVPLHQIKAIYLLPSQLGGPLRRLVLDDVVREAEEATLKDWTSENDTDEQLLWLGEFFRDLSMALMTVRSSRRVKQAVATDYYISK